MLTTKITNIQKQVNILDDIYNGLEGQMYSPSGDYITEVDQLRSYLGGVITSLEMELTGLRALEKQIRSLLQE